MNGKCIFGGKKGIAAALLAAAMALFLLFGCKNIEEGDEIQPPAPEQGPGDNSGANQGGEQKPDEGENQGGEGSGGEQKPGEEENSGGIGGEEGGNDDPILEDVYEIDSLVLTNENLRPKQVSEILNSLRFDYTITTPSTGYSYQQSYIFYENLPQEIKNELHFKETTETGGVERDSEYAFSEVKKEISFEIFHGEKFKLKKTLKNGNYDYSKVLKIISGMLKEIIGEADYSAIATDAASGNLTFTAENVKAVYDFFPTLEKYAELGKTTNAVEDTSIILQNKEAFVAQAEGEVEIKLGPIYPDWYEVYPESFNEDEAEKKCTVKYKKDFAFEGEFNLDELQFEKVDGAQGNFDEATLTNNGTGITIYEINQIRGSSVPILKFDKTEDNVVPSNNPYKDIDDGSEVYYLYHDYMFVDLNRIQIKGKMTGTVIDGSK